MVNVPAASFVATFGFESTKLTASDGTLDVALHANGASP